MAITSSAKKAIRVSARKQAFNIRRSRTMKSKLKTFRQLTLAGQTTEGTALLAESYQAIDKALKRGIIKANTAARKKSRLVRLLKVKSVK